MPEDSEQNLSSERLDDTTLTANEEKKMSSKTIKKVKVGGVTGESLFANDKQEEEGEEEETKQTLENLVTLKNINLQVN